MRHLEAEILYVLDIHLVYALLLSCSNHTWSIGCRDIEQELAGLKEH